MRRTLVAFATAGLLALSACGGPDAPEPAPTTASAPGSIAPASPTDADQPTSAPSGATDPTKLDGALLQPEQLPGWERVDTEQPPLGSTVEPAGCQTTYEQTLGKAASDMGATAAFQRGDQYLQQYVDLVDRGADSVRMVEEAAAACPEFSTVDAGERTSATVLPLGVPSLGERSFGLKVRIAADPPAELLYVWVAHRDVVTMLHLDGPRADERTLVETARIAADRLQTQL